jgi:hypothetical protein
MTYKTVFVSIAGKNPTRFAEVLNQQVTDLAEEGYETLAILPITHDNGSTLGMLVTARSSEKSGAAR